MPRTESLDLTRIGALLGDSARANMVLALFKVPALTATELADEGGVTRATASAHLRKLLDEGLLSVRPAGRHRYFEIADPEVAYHIEQMLGLAQHLRQARTRPGPVDPSLRRARRCYDHLAGEIAVSLFERLRCQDALTCRGKGLELTPRGEAQLAQLGLNPAGMSGSRPICRECLDWSERRPHLAGSVGTAMLERFIALGWLLAGRSSRALTVTVRGERGLNALFQV